MKDIRTVGELKSYLYPFVDSAKVCLEDPNFGGPYSKDPHITVSESNDMDFVFIHFPFEEAVD